MVTNIEKYKTIKERGEQFDNFCSNSNNCKGCPLDKKCRNLIECVIAWLELEAKEEKPLPCPFCRSEVKVDKLVSYEYYVHCTNSDCDMKPKSRLFSSKDEAITAWNKRV